MANKAAKPIFIVSGVLAVFALIFGLCMLFGRHLPEGVLVVGLGFCIFGTAGLLTTLGGDGKSPDAEAARPKRQKKTDVSQKDKSDEAHTNFLQGFVANKREANRARLKTRQIQKAVAEEKSYEVSVNPIGYNPVQGTLALTNTCMKITSGNETLMPAYDAINNLRLQTPVLYIDWDDGTTWEMQFMNPMATSVVHKKLKHLVG